MIAHEIINTLFTSQHFSPLTASHITPDKLAPVIQQVLAYPDVQLVDTYVSFEQRPIYHLRLGHGPQRILLWSQMHGDESTATAALMDFVHLLTQHTADCLPDLNDWQNHLSIHIVPMLNPDGAAQQTRCNAQYIDINRDALALQSPEGRILDTLIDTIRPDCVLNLHDQNPYHSVGSQAATSTVALLATVGDEQKTVTTARARAMHLIESAYPILTQYVDGHIARFADTFSARSFGDNISGRGISTILIESGVYPNDPLRQMARRMNVLTFFTIIDALLISQPPCPDQHIYWCIPEQQDDIYVDIKLTELRIQTDNHGFVIDVTINYNELGQAIIESIGDASTQRGFIEVSLAHYQLLSEYACLRPEQPAELIFQHPHGHTVDLQQLLSLV